MERPDSSMERPDSADSVMERPYRKIAAQGETSPTHTSKAVKMGRSLAFVRTICHF